MRQCPTDHAVPVLKSRTILDDGRRRPCAPVRRPRGLGGACPEPLRGLPAGRSEPLRPRKSGSFRARDLRPSTTEHETACLLNVCSPSFEDKQGADRAHLKLLEIKDLHGAQGRNRTSDNLIFSHRAPLGSEPRQGSLPGWQNPCSCSRREGGALHRPVGSQPGLLTLRS